MSIIASLFFFIGLALSFFGYIGLLQLMNLRKKSKKITISKEEKILSFEEKGMYSISFSTSSFFSPNEVKIRLKDENGVVVSLLQNNFRYKFFYSWENWEECSFFEIEKTGNYIISLPSDSRTSVEVLVSMTRKNIDKILAIISSVIGLNIFGWGIMLACNPDILNKMFP